MFWVVEVPSATGDENVKFPGANANPAPVPERVAGTARLAPLFVKPSEPVVVPAELGVKVTLKPVLCPAGIVTGNVIPLKPKPAPLSVSAVTVTLAPVAVRVPACGALVVPIDTFVNVKADGEIESCAAVTEKAAEFELPPPGAGLVTTTEKLPLVAKSVALS